MTIRLTQETVRPTAQVGNIKVSPTAFQGQFEARKGVERAIGGAFLTIARDMQNLQFTTELADAQVSYDQSFREFQNNELSNPDHIGSTARFDKFHETITSGITAGMKDGRARRQAEFYFSGLKSRQGTKVQADAFKSQALEAQAKITPTLESYAQQFTDARSEKGKSEIMSAADTYLNLLHVGDPSDPSKLGNLLDSAQLIQRQEEWMDILEETVQADIFLKARDTAMGFETVEQATDFIDGLSGVMDRPARNDLLAQVERKFEARDAENKQALDAQQVTDRQNILNRFIKEEYQNIDDFINASTLDPKEKLSWIEKSEKRVEAINSDKEDPFLQTDSTKYFELYRKIQADPDSVSEDDLAAVVGLGEGGIPEQRDLTSLEPKEEDKFQTEFAKVAKSLGINNNPDDPKHFYDYRGLFKDTGALGVGPQKHFPSKYKLLGHPNLIVNGKDTRTGEIATPELIAQNKAAREGEVIQGGISISDYEKLLGMKQVDNPLRRPANVRAQAAIQRMRATEQRFDLEIEEIEEDIAVEDKYLRIGNDLDEFILKNPDVTDEQIEAKAKQLLQPTAERVTIGFMNSLFFPKAGGSRISRLIGRVIGTEEELLAKDKLRAFEKRAIFQETTAGQKEKARKAFELGATVQEVIDAINEENIERLR